jgi:uncharacterized protein (TIGR03083 family)
MGMQAEARSAAELWDRIERAAHALEPADLDKPTPCARWSVRDLVAHLGGLQTMLDESAPQPESPDGWAPDPQLSPLDAWTEAGVAARRAWPFEWVLDELAVAKAGHVARLESADPDAEAAGPLGQSNERKLYGVRMFDLWVHVQDLAVALGGKPDWDDDSVAARDAWEHIFGALPYVAVKKAGAQEAQRLRVTLDQPAPSDRVLAVTGGRAAWDDAGEGAPDTVRAHPAALALLLAGRGTPEEWRADGVLDWEGPFAAAFVERGRVFS